MSNQPLAAEPPPILNESDRVVIALPDEVATGLHRKYIPVAIEAPLGKAAAEVKVLHFEPGALPFYGDIELLWMLRRHRANLAGDRTLCLNNRVVGPDDYMRCWEAALARPRSLEQFSEHTGLHVLVTIGAVHDIVRKSLRTDRTSPIKSFVAFERQYGDRFIRTPWGQDQTMFELTLDLHEPNAARDLFFSADFVTRHPDANCRVRACLQPADPASGTQHFVRRQRSWLEED